MASRESLQDTRDLGWERCCPGRVGWGARDSRDEDRAQTILRQKLVFPWPKSGPPGREQAWDRLRLDLATSRESTTERSLEGNRLLQSWWGMVSTSWSCTQSGLGQPKQLINALQKRRKRCEHRGSKALSFKLLPGPERTNGRWQGRQANTVLPSLTPPPPPLQSWRTRGHIAGRREEVKPWQVNLIKQTCVDGGGRGPSLRRKFRVFTVTYD